MRGALLAVLLMLCAGQVSAQAITVRAGEHADFTRLVFYLPERIPFALTRQENTAILSFERSDIVFDISAVFQRVPRTRLTALAKAPAEGVLRLSLACNCNLKTFWNGRAALVLDISDETGPPPETNSADMPALGTDTNVLNPLPLPASRSSLSARLTAAGLAREKDGSQPAPPAASDGAALTESRQELLTQLSRAASQGLLSPRVPHLSAPRRNAGTKRPERQAPRPVPTPEAGLSDPGSNINLRAESSIDRDAHTKLAARSTPAMARACSDPVLFDVRNWADDRPFWMQIGALRKRLLREFDTPDRDAVMALARLYVHFGFGVEARQLLLQLGSRSKPERILLAMSSILEDGDVAESSILAGQMDCAPPVALWSALNYASLPDDEPIDTDAILQGFSALPPHLRAYLGPRLIRLFINGDYWRESDQLRRILERNDAMTSPEAKLVSAEIALSKGQTKAAEGSLEALAEENAAPSAEALLRLIRSRLKRNGDISYQTAQLAAAYAMENRGQPLSRELARAHVLALAASGAFDEAFAAFDDLDSSSPDERRSLVSQIVDILVQRADDYDFARHVTSAPVDPDILYPATSNDVIERLLSLGFVSEAAQFATPDAPFPAARKRQLLRARIALRNGRPHQAEAALLSLSGKDADLLRAKAKSLAGDHRAAREVFDNLGQADAARREAWLGSDWTALGRDESPVLSAIAREKLVPKNTMSDPKPGVLDTDRRLLEASAATRDRMAALLSIWPPPDQR